MHLETCRLRQQVALEKPAQVRLARVLPGHRKKHHVGDLTTLLPAGCIGCGRLRPRQYQCLIWPSVRHLLRYTNSLILVPLRVAIIPVQTSTERCGIILQVHNYVTEEILICQLQIVFLLVSNNRVATEVEKSPYDQRRWARQ